MKSYNEMAQSVLSRINEYEAAEKRKRKIFIKTAVPAAYARRLLRGLQYTARVQRELLPHLKAARPKVMKVLPRIPKVHRAGRGKSLHMRMICAAW